MRTSGSAKGELIEASEALRNVSMSHAHGHGGGPRREWQDAKGILEDAGIREGLTVADLGCGSGFFTLPMASMVGEKGTVYAVDSSQEALERLNENIRSGGDRGTVRTVKADVSKTGIPPGSVDVAFFANVFHDIDDREGFLREVKRILRPTGYAVDIDWRRVETEFGPPFEMRLDQGSVEEFLADNGFGIARTLEVGPYHYGLVAVQKPS